MNYNKQIKRYSVYFYFNLAMFIAFELWGLIAFGNGLYNLSMLLNFFSIMFILQVKFSFIANCFTIQDKKIEARLNEIRGIRTRTKRVKKKN